MNYNSKIPFHLLILVVLLMSVSCQNTRLLFKENANEWFEKGDASWQFDGHNLIGSSNNGSGFLITKTSYKDFVLEMEFMPDSTINSGVFVRCKNYEISPTDCFEVNIWDLHPNQEYRTGAIVLKSKPLAIVETIGKWNALKIKIKINHIQVWVNGVLTVDFSDSALNEGFIGLQASGKGQIVFRNIRIITSKVD